MNTKLSVLAGAVVATLAMGVSAPASASIYARSYLEVENLRILISDDGGLTGGGATIDNFNFALTNTANLNGAAVIGVGGCNGLPGVGGGPNNCSAGSPTTNAAVQNLGAAAAVRAENVFDFKGPGLNEYANSDSVIWQSELVGAGVPPATPGGPSHTEQIAESELQTGISAGSSAEIISTTGFTMSFTVDGANVLAISFDALLNILSQINDPTAAAASSQANVRVNFQLQNDVTGDLASWSPNGGAGGCISTFGVCTELFDTFDLNTDSGTTTDGTTGAGSRSGTGTFFAIFDGLFNGDWTLTLDAVTSTALSRTPAVPEPASLALLGIGLAGLAGARKRRKA